ncbi:hypothetical protein DICPUDRAFT_78336 [Dictyostelium purpureum]|uniref:EGF-like domain-containing protein n=1 Tax=Dictyostelium purpureum TaxID=5786 RepID=F0ZJ89_DICPU|nr:uncharacterized protein DICPUDRAFT_78336 [Dictyostelium purpureum]EGC35993.1 hypothetical protein DICPUDRAFT_78336 [Dictyostelium purpureum]|eukprot:XP_003287494.1 hypothetical protein DICPUDRAFT_78336 [Dictyostelium purpureum]
MFTECYCQNILSIRRSDLIRQFLFVDDTLKCSYATMYYIQTDSSYLIKVSEINPPTPFNRTINQISTLFLYLFSFDIETSGIVEGSTTLLMETNIDKKSVLYSYSCNFPTLKDKTNIAVSSLTFRDNWITGYFKVNDFDRSTLMPTLIVDSTRSSVPCLGNLNLCLVTTVNNYYQIYISPMLGTNPQEINIYFTSQELTSIDFNVTFSFYKYDKISFYKTNSFYSYPSQSNIVLNSVNNFKAYSFINITSDKPIKYLLGRWDSQDKFQTNSKLISNSADKLNSIWLVTTSSTKTFYSFYNNLDLLINVTNPGTSVVSSTPSYNYSSFNSYMFTYTSVSDNFKEVVPIGAYHLLSLEATSILWPGNSFRIGIGLDSLPEISSFDAVYPFGVQSAYSLLGDSFKFTIQQSVYATKAIVATLTTLQEKQKNLASDTETDLSLFGDIEFKNLNYGYWSIKLVYTPNGTPDSGFLMLYGQSQIYLKKSHLVYSNSTSSIYSTVFKLQANSLSSQSPEDGFIFTIYKESGVMKQYRYFDYISAPKYPGYEEKFTIVDFYFKTPAMNLTSKGGYNSAYLKIKFDNENNLFFYQPFFALTPKLNRNIHFGNFAPFYLNSEGIYQVDFYVPANLPTGELDYTITNSLKNSAKLTSDYMKFIFSDSKDKVNLRSYSLESDSMPPILKSISVVSSPVLFDIKSQIYAEWLIVIEEGLNGFDWGFVTVQSKRNTYAKYSYNVTFNQIDEQGKYRISVPVECYNQPLEISNLTLVDKQGFKSEYSRYSSNVGSGFDYDVVDPFMKVLSDERLPEVEVVCKEIPTSTPAPLLNLDILVSSTDVFVYGGLSFTFTFTHPDGTSENQLPILYLSGGLGETIVTTPAKILERVSATQTKYIAPVTIPFGFAYPNPIDISIYGLVSKKGECLGYPSKYQIITNSKAEIPPTALSVLPFYSKGGKLYVFGKGFTAASTINFITGAPGATDYITHVEVEGSVLSINIGPTEIPFTIIVSNTPSNNQIKVTPIIYRDVGAANENHELPTNPPKKCLGSPVCGGIENGYCSDKGCICYSPWIGDSCQSKVITIPPPVVNPNEPSANLTTDPNDFSLISLISLVSLKELDIYNKEVKIYRFDKWNQTQIDKNTHFYSTDIKANDGSLICTVGVSTIWFEELSNITFANQQLTMNPSSLKYNINITSYPFESTLNRLQLLISASTQSNEEDNVCSGQDFGETVADNSDYIKLQINKHSLYGRFIKRGIIDNSNVSISNDILSDRSNETYYSSGTYIAVNIPYFNFLAQLDPDFSVLLEGNSANSICKNKSGLSKGAIIGIVVGCVGGAIIITIAILLIIKYQYQIKIIKNKIKMEKM